MNSRSSKTQRSSLLFGLLLLVSNAARADEVTDWHDQMLTAIGNAGLNPIASTREGALVSAAIFDAVNGIERRYEPIHVSKPAPRGASTRAAAVQAAYVVLRSRFPAQADALKAQRRASLAAIGDGQAKQRGIQWGEEVANAILAWRSTDGITPAPPPYLGGTEAGQWRPTPPGNAPGLLPQFATLTPWGILSPDQFRPAGPPPLDSDQYRQEFEEVALMGRVDSPVRTADETDACHFWAATGPTYLWNRTAMDLAANAELSLSQNAHLLATLNIAIADAIIACWDSKYFYSFWRPVTAIQLGDDDQNDATIGDPDWTPLIVTPGFPEYVSGHSCASSAAALVLGTYFGENTPFVLQSQANPSWTRAFPNFAAALEEVADARIFGGIHFRAACDDGVTVGTSVAAFILENSMQRIHGKGD